MRVDKIGYPREVLGFLLFLAKPEGFLGFSQAPNFAADPHHFRLLRIVLML